MCGVHQTWHCARQSWCVALQSWCGVRESGIWFRAKMCTINRRNCIPSVIKADFENKDKSWPICGVSSLIHVGGTVALAFYVLIRYSMKRETGKQGNCCCWRTGVLVNLIDNSYANALHQIYCMNYFSSYVTYCYQK